MEKFKLKRSNTSPFVEELSKDIGTIYTCLFSSTGIGTDIKEFLYQFEEKRGDADKKALQDCSQVFQDLLLNLTEAKNILNENFETIQSNVSSSCNLMKEMLPLEQKRQEERDLVRNEKVPFEELERKKFLEQEIQKRKEIEIEVDKRLAELRK